MRLPQDGRQKCSCAHGFLVRDLIDFKFQILRQQLPQKDGLSQQMRGLHALAERGRKLSRSFDHSFGIVLGILHPFVRGAAAGIASLISIKQ
jgi:hypothetical protein